MSERVAIVGGGVIGCAVARELAPDYDVEVFEKGQLASEASALAAGEITMLSSYEDEPAVGWHAVDFFREYDGTGEFSYTELPSIGLVTPDREDEKRRYASRVAADDLPVRYLEREEASEAYPTFDFSDHAGVIEHGVSGFVDPYTFAITLHHDARDDGATFHTDTAVHDLLVEDGEVTGLETEDGRAEADHVVCAAGWRTREFLLEYTPIPVRPYRTQCIVLEPETPLPDGFPMGWYPGEHVYFRPEHNGDFLIGGWSFAEENPEGASGQADAEFRNHVAELVPTFLEGFEEAGYVDGWAGVDGATPDTRPILDAPADAPDGLVVATGFNGRGVMTAPVAATAVRSLLTGEDAPFSLDTFAIDRFDTRSDDFEFISISAGN
ncbi:FAD-dependent oxidoreductase (plasmid) [Natrialba magadii ATCC 43099]|uniref:FAD-dependent oxidoreductase n=1 Tax=Natrialba magadii (strain ATCC 43099 / DSM 3394 / CCM 3739 / CIP 104546 / IAM 13178 / JCM 8861 / NBRC 102185 / NCIMB 2190 / MS3) TaxID=547559 RepID=D3T1C7_NATMM|nr:FAD-dependent oxidoreductase [Natrialba magadii]ADD07386.1 FAD-dependent oxidoreductase [Natrialba magadii ATCC 43099]ELY32410.1 FAD dependent oxidoreductase [Natrialba magadii ATCC 43099]